MVTVFVTMLWCLSLQSHLQCGHLRNMPGVEDEERGNMLVGLLGCMIFLSMENKCFAKRVENAGSIWVVYSSLYG